MTLRACRRRVRGAVDLTLCGRTVLGLRCWLPQPVPAAQQLCTWCAPLPTQTTTRKLLLRVVVLQVAPLLWADGTSWLDGCARAWSCFAATVFMLALTVGSAPRPPGQTLLRCAAAAHGACHSRCGLPELAVPEVLQACLSTLAFRERSRFPAPCLCVLTTEANAALCTYEVLLRAAMLVSSGSCMLLPCWHFPCWLASTLLLVVRFLVSVPCHALLARAKASSACCRHASCQKRMQNAVLLPASSRL